ncbi:hypothetical protein ACXWRW_11470, partial [Streptococcus pyogenes]
TNLHRVLPRDELLSHVWHSSSSFSPPFFSFSLLSLLFPLSLPFPSSSLPPFLFLFSFLLSPSFLFPLLPPPLLPLPPLS